jgi:hypothetical protein
MRFDPEANDSGDVGNIKSSCLSGEDQASDLAGQTGFLGIG